MLLALAAKNAFAVIADDRADAFFFIIMKRYGMWRTHISARFASYAMIFIDYRFASITFFGYMRLFGEIGRVGFRK
jgi:hypothetical protein